MNDNGPPKGSTEKRLRLSLCMIVRDNERTICECLESVKPWVDEMVVVDTGSTDRTPEIAAEFGARVFHFPWCDDFAAARNESLRYAVGEWLFWMDSDDTISVENGRRLRELADLPLDGAPMAYVMQVHCPAPLNEGREDATVVDHVKMFRNRPDLQFEGRIHEQVLASIRRLGGEIEWTDVFVVHSGSDQSAEGRKRKQERDLRLIDLELKEHPNHTFHLFNLGMTFADMGEHVSAVDALRRSIAAAFPEDSHLRKAYALLVASRTQLGQHEEAMRVCREGLNGFPNDAELNFRRGIVAHELGQLDEAVEAYSAALTTRENRHFASLDRGICGYKARHNLAIVYGEMGREELAELQWRLVVEEVPSYRIGWHRLGQSLLSRARYVACEVEVARMRSFDLEVTAILVEFELAIARQQREVARRLLTQAAQAFPGDVELLRARSRFFFELGEWQEAELALRELCKIDPEDGANHHNFGTVLMQLNRLSESAEAFRRSLAVRPTAPHTQSMYDQVTLQLA